MHKKTDTAIATWEHHFQKLQYGLLFDENNPDVIDTSEDENCNKNNNTKRCWSIAKQIKQQTQNTFIKRIRL